MELRVLNYFLAIAREENMTKAARTLHVTQPVLSRQMAQLEDELGVKLFTRSNHRIRLTEDGLLLRRRAQELVTLAEKTKREFVRRETALTGEIAIGSGEFRSTQVFSKLMTDFRSLHPLVQYRIYSGNADNIQDYIQRGLLDLGLMGEPVDIRKYEFVPLPIRERWGILVPKNSGLAEKESIRLEDLNQVPLIMASRSEVFQNELNGWFGEQAGRLEIAATGNLLYNEAMLAQSGMGAVLCIQLNCTYDGLRFIPLSPVVESRTVLAWKKDQVFSPATAAFLEYAEKYLKSISSDRR